MTSSSKTPSVGVVYFIRSRQTNLCKIGMTGNWSRRSKELLVGEQADEITRANTFNPAGVEKALHQAFASCRLPQSEWFSLTDEQVQQVVSALTAAQTAFDAKQEDPRIRLLTLQARLAKARNQQQREVCLSVIRSHMEKHFPEELAQQDAQAEAARQAEAKAEQARADAEWHSRSLREQVLGSWLAIWFAAALLFGPFFILCGLISQARVSECPPERGIPTCPGRLFDQTLHTGLWFYGFGVAGTMAWSAKRLKRQKQLFREGKA